MNQKNTLLTNHLVNETSPYLKQHMAQPIDWYPWGDEAFQKAKNEDKPIFLSIGYSTCHWCHVMAKESFMDKTVAEYLNQNYISIKVDKEEHPDVDSVYMEVCEHMTGQGGWPLTIIMTPEQKPFFAATYIPKNTSSKGLGLKDILLTFAHLWNTDRLKLEEDANNIIQLIHKEKDKKITIQEDVIKSGYEMLKYVYDSVHGGFGFLPKFPSSTYLMFLLRYSYYYQDKDALNMVTKTLQKMMNGGIFDQIGFGFFRYSTDRKWNKPHYEKMLYDNALLTICYLEAYQYTKNKKFKETAEKILMFTTENLKRKQGGFYAAIDADSEGVEGKYYLFTQDEIIRLLGEVEGKEFSKVFHIKDKPSLPFLSGNHQNQNTEFLRLQVKQYRENRTSIAIDHQLLTTWNAMMIMAYALAYKITDKEDYIRIAFETYEFLKKEVYKDNIIYIQYHKKDHGTLLEYAFFALSGLYLFEATYNENYLEDSLKVTKEMIHQFFDEKEGGFYLKSKEDTSLILSLKPLYDGAIPSGNSIATYCLVKLSKLFDDELLQKTLEKQLDFMSQKIEYSMDHTFFLFSLMEYLHPSIYVTCLYKENKIHRIKKRMNQKFSPNVIKRFVKVSQNDKTLLENKVTYQVCIDHYCMPPTTSFNEVNELIDQENHI